MFPKVDFEQNIRLANGETGKAIAFFCEKRRVEIRVLDQTSQVRLIDLDLPSQTTVNAAVWEQITRLENWEKYFKKRLYASHIEELRQFRQARNNLKDNGKRDLHHRFADTEFDQNAELCCIELSQQSGRRLRRISKALGRLSLGQYGICEDCGNPIGVLRLQARPWSETCLHCTTVK